MGKMRTLAGLAAVSLGVLFAVWPETAWKHAAWTWYLISGIPDLQHLCFDHNPLLSWLFKRAEAAYLAGPGVPMPVVKELDKSEYSWTRLGQVSEGYMNPVVVRGMFADSPGRALWEDPFYWANTFPEATPRAIVPYEPWRWKENCASDAGASGDAALPKPTTFEVIAKAIVAGQGVKSAAWAPSGVNASKVMNAIPHSLMGDDVPVATEPLMFITQPPPGGTPSLSTDWHCAFLGNYAAHIKGAKTWHLVPPQYGHLIRPTNWQHGLVPRAYPDDDVLAKAPNVKVTLEAGDLLYLPPWWWHTVSHAGKPEYTVLATVRVFNNAQAPRLQPYLSLHAYYGFAYNAVMKWLNLDAGYSAKMLTKADQS